MYRKFGKRAVDIAAGFFGILLLLPLMLVLAVLVRFKLGSPIIFSQERPGKDEKIFKLYKFRTMTDKRDENGELLPDGERLTSFGKALRSSSLDELPQLWNILKGDMSLVGPRPLMVEYLPLYTAEQARRHYIKPGLTGNAQVNGRNAIGWDEKFTYDCCYVDNISLWLDVKLIFQTALKVLGRRGITPAAQLVVKPFTGSVEVLTLGEIGMGHKDLVVYGAGGFGREVIWQTNNAGRYNILGYVDDNAELWGKEINGFDVLGGIDWLLERDKEICAVIGIGNPRVRYAVYNRLKDNPLVTFPSIIAKNVHMSDSVSLGQGCIVCLSNILTVNAALGDFVVVNLDCTIGHDGVLGDFVTLYPGVNVSGNVRIGAFAEIGSGANIIPGRSIGENAIIGAGAVVTADIPANCTAVGVPAEPIKYRV